MSLVVENEEKNGGILHPLKIRKKLLFYRRMEENYALIIKEMEDDLGLELIKNVNALVTYLSADHSFCPRNKRR